MGASKPLPTFDTGGYCSDQGSRPTFVKGIGYRWGPEASSKGSDPDEDYVSTNTLWLIGGVLSVLLLPLMVVPVLAALAPLLFAISPVLVCCYAAYCYSESTKKQKGIFLTDEEIGGSTLFQLFEVLTLGWSKWFHAIEVVGSDNFPQDKTKGVMLLGFHTTHNADILLSLFMVHAETGRAVRGMLHRSVFAFNPWLIHFGLAPGDRSTAIELLKAGHISACIPGGAEEALRGHDDAYTMDWRSSSGNTRTGFAKVVEASGAGTAAVPVFVANGEEMRFNPVTWAANKIGFTTAFMQLTKLTGTGMPLVAKLCFQVAIYTWFFVSLLSIPVPAKVTMFIGDAGAD